MVQRAPKTCWMQHSAAAGFTLIELVLVIAVIAILAAIAVPRFGNSLARYQADAAARRIAADLALAQRRARATSASQTVQFNVSGNTYTLVGLAGLDRSTASYVVDLAADPYEAQLVLVQVGGDDQLVFDGYGVPDSGARIAIMVHYEGRAIVMDATTGQVTISEVAVVDAPGGGKELDLPPEFEPL